MTTLEHRTSRKELIHRLAVIGCLVLPLWHLPAQSEIGGKDKLAFCEVDRCKLLAWEELTRQRPRAASSEYTFVGLTFTHDPSQVLKRDFITVSYRLNIPVKTVVETSGEIQTTARFFEIFDVELTPTGRIVKTGTRQERRVDIGQEAP